MVEVITAVLEILLVLNLLVVVILLSLWVGDKITYRFAPDDLTTKHLVIGVIVTTNLMVAGLVTLVGLVSWFLN